MSDVFRTIEMRGPGGNAVIPASEKEAKLALGWKIVKQQPKEQAEEIKKQEEVPEFPKEEKEVEKPEVNSTVLIPSARSVRRTGLSKLNILNNDFQLGLKDVLDSDIPISKKREAINDALSKLR